MTQLSCTLVRAPTTIGLAFWSDLKTAPHQILASSPTVTSPIKTAVGAIKALGEMFGLLPLYSIIITALTSLSDQFFNSKFFAAMSVIAWPMAKEAVAPGDGALRT